MPAVKNKTVLHLVLAAGLLILGERLGFALSPFARLWPVAVSVTGLVALAIVGWPCAARIGKPLLLVLAGIVLALRTDLHRTQLQESQATLDLPVESDVETWRERKTGTWRAVFTSHAGPLPLKVVLRTNARETAPRIGEVWRCTGRISRKERHGNRFAPRSFWVSEPRFAQRVATAPAFSAVALYTACGDEFAKRLSAGLDWSRELASLNQAILLGRRAGLSKEKRQMFADAGTVHVFAISGLHVMVVAYLFQTLLERLGASATSRSLLVIPLVWAYTVLTGTRPSAVRAALMATFWMAAPLFGHRPNSLAAWSWTALIVYGLAPERVFDLGCTLSFAVMFGIVAWLAWSGRFKPLFHQEDPLRRQTFFSEYGAANGFLSRFGVSFAAWLAGVPITAATFGRVTPGGLLANLVVVVCADWMVKVGIGGILASFVCLPLAALLNNAAAALTWTMTAVSARVAALPLATFDVKPWSLTQCLLWYGAWAAVFLLFGYFRRPKISTAHTWW